MTDGRSNDLRPPLRLARDTWDRAGPAARRRLVHEAARLGYRLVIEGPDREPEEPDPDLAAW